MAWWKQWGFTEDKHKKEGLALLAGKLVLALMIETPAANAFRELAIVCGSQADPATIKIETLLFEKFLLVQACAYNRGFSQAVINKVVIQLDDAFE